MSSSSHSVTLVSPGGSHPSARPRPQPPTPGHPPPRPTPQAAPAHPTPTARRLRASTALPVRRRPAPGASSRRPPAPTAGPCFACREIKIRELQVHGSLLVWCAMETHRLWLRGVRRRDAGEGPRPAQAPPRPQAERRARTGGASDSGEARREEKAGTARGGHARHFFHSSFCSFVSARSRVKPRGGGDG
jgi:hypothetical protein